MPCNLTVKGMEDHPYGGAGPKKFQQAFIDRDVDKQIPGGTDFTQAFSRLDPVAPVNILFQDNSVKGCFDNAFIFP